MTRWWEQKLEDTPEQRAAVEVALNALVDAIHAISGFDKADIRRWTLSGYSASCEWERYTETAVNAFLVSHYMDRFKGEKGT